MLTEFIRLLTCSWLGRTMKRDAAWEVDTRDSQACSKFAKAGQLLISSRPKSL